jgi:polyisoprenyl-phosphate glycosyltransferase
MSKISIVIPVYKSGNIIKNTVEQTLEELGLQGVQCEIILINDGSPDNSWSVIKELAKKYEEVHAINLVKKLRST